MKRLLVVLAMTFVCLASFAQESDSTVFKGTFINSELKIKCILNLYEDAIPVPGLEMDKCYGYLDGNINGMWVILKVQKMEDKKAVVRAMSDRGDDAQSFELVRTDDGISLRQIDGANMKGIANNKYVKLPKTVLFKQ